jgi:hypothetical protein
MLRRLFGCGTLQSSQVSPDHSITLPDDVIHEILSYGTVPVTKQLILSKVYRHRYQWRLQFSRCTAELFMINTMNRGMAMQAAHHKRIPRHNTLFMKRNQMEVIYRYQFAKHPVYRTRRFAPMRKLYASYAPETHALVHLCYKSYTLPKNYVLNCHLDPPSL